MEECRHIRVNGTKCRAAALTSNAWCFFHDRIYKERAAHPQPRVFTQFALPADTLDYGCVPVTAPEPQQQPQDLPIELPLIEDLSSIQLAISRILLALAANTIHPKRAGLMLYGLQIAAQNLPKRPLDRSDTVTDVAYTEDNIPFDATPFYAYKTISMNEEEEDDQDDIDTAEQDDEGYDEDEEEEEDGSGTRTAETYQQIAARLKLILHRLDASADLRVPHPREAGVGIRATREPLSSARLQPSCHRMDALTHPASHPLPTRRTHPPCSGDISSRAASPQPALSASAQHRRTASSPPTTGASMTSAPAPSSKTA